MCVCVRELRDWSLGGMQPALLKDLSDYLSEISMLASIMCQDYGRTNEPL